MKICSKCKEVKPSTREYFGIDKRNKNGLSGACRDCRNIEKKEHRKNNPEQTKEYNKKYRENNIEAAREYQIEYNIINADKVSARRAEYSKNNREIYNISNQKRRARMKGLTSTLTVQEWKNAIEYFNNECCYCGRKEPLVQEHFIPVSKGGGYTANNIIPSCKSCNSSKGIKDFYKWYPNQREYNIDREKRINGYLKGWG